MPLIEHLLVQGMLGHNTMMKSRIKTSLKCDQDLLAEGRGPSHERVARVGAPDARRSSGIAARNGVADERREAPLGTSIALERAAVGGHGHRKQEVTGTAANRRRWRPDKPARRCWVFRRNRDIGACGGALLLRATVNNNAACARGRNHVLPPPEATDHRIGVANALVSSAGRGEAP
ncbi:hypothetical protein HPB52_010860 [Rhipicephalus sanguineus]|uniref:Uncharacterized protein n=1 Tax=Rhipicephalus sanguineus TaxID=34632 RepID=A0A9D4T3H8_RHISA|nr:hypothetical protein HPB52_010860 [Rhipicephalus sanguineus]